jgi:hypothetical protein
MKGPDTTPALVLAGTTTPEQVTTKNTWNTKNLTSRLGADFLSAASAASMVAPLIAIIDRYDHPIYFLHQPLFCCASLRHVHGRHRQDKKCTPKKS